MFIDLPRRLVSTFGCVALCMCKHYLIQPIWLFLSNQSDRNSSCRSISHSLSFFFPCLFSGWHWTLSIPFLLCVSDFYMMLLPQKVFFNKKPSSCFKVSLAVCHTWINLSTGSIEYWPASTLWTDAPVSPTSLVPVWVDFLRTEAHLSGKSLPIESNVRVSHLTTCTN